MFTRRKSTSPEFLSLVGVGCRVFTHYTLHLFLLLLLLLFVISIKAHAGWLRSESPNHGLLFNSSSSSALLSIVYTDPALLAGRKSNHHNNVGQHQWQWPHSYKQYIQQEENMVSSFIPTLCKVKELLGERSCEVRERLKTASHILEL